MNIIQKPLKSQMQVNVPGVEFLGTPPWFVSRREISHYVHAVTAREKSVLQVQKLLFCLLNIFLFLAFSSPSGMSSYKINNGASFFSHWYFTFIWVKHIILFLCPLRASALLLAPHIASHNIGELADGLAPLSFNSTGQIYWYGTCFV